MIIKETLKQVLKTGQLTNLPFGSTYAQFVKLLGQVYLEEDEDFVYSDRLDYLNRYICPTIGMSTFTFNGCTDIAELVRYYLEFWPQLPKENFRINYNSWNYHLIPFIH